MRITRERHVYSLGVSEPVATVTAPCSLTVETCDCFNGQVTEDGQPKARLNFLHVNPATGPIVVEGAEPGDVLRVHIRAIRPEKTGALMTAHAAMGDGEVSVTGLEVFGEVDLDLSLEKGASLPCPLLHDGDEVSFLASAETVDGAIHASTGYMHDFLLAKTSLNADEALMLMSLCGHARISQIVDPLKTARFAMPVSVLAKFGVVVE